MKKFLGENFLLKTDKGQELYHEYAKKLPIFDYHCHLPVQEIAENKKFKNITELWLYHDHYKWRAMRANGIDEKYCTGSASDIDKFKAWANTLPFAIRNPLYHWTHLELKNFFNIEDIQLNPSTAQEIYDRCNTIIDEKALSPYAIFKKMKVKLICTTDDPTDSLEFHSKILADADCPARVYPTFRPDKGLNVENPALFNAWITKLGEISTISIKQFSDYIAALKSRHDFFHSVGCRLSDHGIDVPFNTHYTEGEIVKIFNKVHHGEPANETEMHKFKTAVLHQIAVWNSEKGWAMQLHIGAMRNNNSKAFTTLGPDRGFDSINEFTIAHPLSEFLNTLHSKDTLPKTILYNLNPKDTEVFAAMIGNFQDGIIPGKLQYGSAWWFLDTKDGMERQINALSNMGLLSRFVGMLTDSRSYLSYTRHEYFRRILCNILGNEIESGEIPDDMEMLGSMVENICYNNAVNYFNLKIK